jgi:hypothetical protein
MSNKHRFDIRRATTEKRYASSVSSPPKSLDKKRRTVEAVLSRGSEVSRYFGKERLRISKSAIDLSRLTSGGGIPIPNSHQQTGIENVLGRLVDAWIEGSGSNAALVGRIKFSETDEGERAFQMVQRGELTSLSVGYLVHAWEIRDRDGKILDEADIIPGDGSATFEATRWQILETSWVAVPADAESHVRSLDRYQSDALARMEARMRMMARSRMIARMVRSSIPISIATRRMLLRRQIADHRTLHGY